MALVCPIVTIHQIQSFKNRAMFFDNGELREVYTQEIMTADTYDIVPAMFNNNTVFLPQSIMDVVTSRIKTSIDGIVAGQTKVTETESVTIGDNTYTSEKINTAIEESTIAKETITVIEKEDTNKKKKSRQIFDTPENIEMFREAVESDMTITELSELFSLAEGTIYRLARKYNMPLHKKRNNDISTPLTENNNTVKTEEDSNKSQETEDKNEILSIIGKANRFKVKKAAKFCYDYNRWRYGQVTFGRFSSKYKINTMQQAESLYKDYSKFLAKFNFNYSSQEGLTEILQAI